MSEIEYTHNVFLNQEVLDKLGIDMTIEDFLADYEKNRPTLNRALRAWPREQGYRDLFTFVD